FASSLYTLSLHDALPILSLRGRKNLPVGSSISSSAGVPVIRGDTAFALRDQPAQKPEIAYFVPSLKRDIVPSIACTQPPAGGVRSEEHTSELQSRGHLVC